MASTRGTLTSLEALGRALFHNASLSHSFMVMTAYFDESGTHGHSPIVIVAGFIASIEGWAGYERDFAALTAEFGVNKFHAKEFRGRKGDFKDWPTRKRALFNSRFLRLADDHLSCGVAAVLPVADYQRIYQSADFPRRARPDTTYGMCVRTALAKCLIFARENKSEWPINVVMELGHSNVGDAIRVFDEVKRGLFPWYAGALGSISFDSKRDCAPLAIADSLAYAVFRMSAGFSKHPTDPNILAVVGPAEPPYYVNKIPLSRTIIDEDSLAQLRDELLVGPGRFLRTLPLS